MCMMVYIAAKEPLELIAWNRAQPAFHVSELSDSDFTVRQQFGAPYVLLQRQRGPFVAQPLWSRQCP